MKCLLVLAYYCRHQWEQEVDNLNWDYTGMIGCRGCQVIIRNEDHHWEFPWRVHVPIPFQANEGYMS